MHSNNEKMQERSPGLHWVLWPPVVNHSLEAAMALSQFSCQIEVNLLKNLH